MNQSGSCVFFVLFFSLATFHRCAPGAEQSTARRLAIEVAVMKSLIDNWLMFFNRNHVQHNCRIRVSCIANLHLCCLGRRFEGRDNKKQLKRAISKIDISVLAAESSLSLIFVSLLRCPEQQRAWNRKKAIITVMSAGVFSVSGIIWLSSPRRTVSFGSRTALVQPNFALF